VLSVITAVDPLVSIGLAVGLLHEPISGGALNITLEVAALAVMTVGIVGLAHRAPQVEKQLARRNGRLAREAAAG
jgi:hypothetical protein